VSKLPRRANTDTDRAEELERAILLLAVVSAERYG
jgi:hypothetical protein